MSKKPLTAILLVAFMTSAIAANAVSPDKASRCRELMALSGMEKTFEAQIAEIARQSQAVAGQMMQQAQAQLPGLSAEQIAALEAEAKAFIQYVIENPGLKAVTDKWIELYSEQLTLEELDGLIEFYKSPLGVRSIEAMHVAMPVWTASFMEQQQTSFQNASQEFFSRVRDISKNK